MRYTPRSNRSQSRSMQSFGIELDDLVVLWDNSVSAPTMVMAGEFCDSEMRVEIECDAIADAEDLVPKVERTFFHHQKVVGGDSGGTSIASGGGSRNSVTQLRNIGSLIQPIFPELFQIASSRELSFLRRRLIRLSAKLPSTRLYQVFFEEVLKPRLLSAERVIYSGSIRRFNVCVPLRSLITIRRIKIPQTSSSSHVPMDNNTRSSSSSRSAEESNLNFLQVLLEFDLEPGGLGEHDHLLDLRV